VRGTVTKKQLAGHEKVANQQGFEDFDCFIIAPAKPKALSDRWTVIEWQDIYLWLREMNNRPNATSWAKHASDFFEILEAKLLEENTLGNAKITTFSGFDNFGADYSYLTAKAQLRKALDQLRSEKLLIDQLGITKAAGRGAITGQATDDVWDRLIPKNPFGIDNHTKFVHFTLSVHRNYVEAVLTVPDKINSQSRNSFKELGLSGLKELMKQVLQGANDVWKIEPYASPRFRGIQRHYPSQRAVPFVDAYVDFDLRTAFTDQKATHQPETQVKFQPDWIDASLNAFLKKKSNYQIQVGFKFDRSRCEALLHPEKALDVITCSWLACKPVLDVVSGTIISDPIVGKPLK